MGVGGIGIRGGRMGRWLSQLVLVRMCDVACCVHFGGVSLSGGGGIGKYGGRIRSSSGIFLVVFPAVTFIVICCCEKGAAGGRIGIECEYGLFVSFDGVASTNVKGGSMSNRCGCLFVCVVSFCGIFSHGGRIGSSFP